jgi:MoaA/NifB/PqqE/SkfB family radical SAM enzyme
MYRYEQIREVHLENTTRCNASCPQCGRNASGDRVNDRLPIVDLSLADVRTILPASFVRQLEHVYLCGNYGDALVARDTLPTLAYLRSCNPDLRLGIVTNGSGRTPEWWRELAGLTQYCRFSIDGLADTNHIYRRGTSWERIIEGARNFISAGGLAIWDFIVFAHNEHQVEEARQLSVDLGFRQFHVKRTPRFRGAERQPVFDREGNQEYFIALPLRVEYRNPAMLRFMDDATYRTSLDAATIRCKAVASHQIFVSAEGLAFPCCWTALVYRRDSLAVELESLLAQLPDQKRSLDARIHPLREIVEGPLFQDLVPGSWRRPSIADGKLEICARICGDVEDNMHAATNLLAPRA